MNRKLLRLTERRERPVAQTSAQREAVAENIEPGRAGKWLGRGWVIWQAMHKLRGS